jgi:hypothetical protein
MRASALLINIACHLPPLGVDVGSVSCQLPPTSSQLAPTPRHLCKRGLSRRFLGRHGSLFAVFGFVEAVPHPVLVVGVFHAPIMRRRRKDFPKVVPRRLAPRRGGCCSGARLRRRSQLSRFGQHAAQRCAAPGAPRCSRSPSHPPQSLAAEQMLVGLLSANAPNVIAMNPKIHSITNP